ncbi:unnamed protein product [Cyberlindnera jadinii]|uniref:Uncharacterized protein n=1 Tax=Cyberlindnera jadinii (strain ATCC 18201 / CBS 1600 / BCRC 20928 / JCM 3617 / NBRC 0987 / NRRL Y-1542) TaxID=983966 RepID=A0A0H5C5I6_CYBJN|nr:unnamed protein product [Cyberlindnera jadinii]
MVVSEDSGILRSSLVFTEPSTEEQEDGQETRTPWPPDLTSSPKEERRWKETARKNQASFVRQARPFQTNLPTRTEK